MDVPMNAKITVEWECPTCEGAMYIYLLTCGTCGAAVCDMDISLLEKAAPGTEITLLCGHSSNEIQDTIPCPECDGEGIFTRSITIMELSEIISTPKLPF